MQPQPVPPKTPTLCELHTDISQKLDEIRALFTVPVKITVLVRTPDLDDGGAIVSDDDLDSAVAEIARLRERDPQLP